MGIDASIYLKTRDGNEPTLPNQLPGGCRMLPVADWAPEGATHAIDQWWRYYGRGYERGPWPTIAAVLMTLHASPDVETVWYFGDSNDGDDPFTPERVQELCAHYMREGHRPY